MLLSRSNSKTSTKNNVLLLPKNYKPCASDILCGRGRSYAKHQGNKQFSDIVKWNIPRYIQGRNRTDRRVIVGSIVEYIEQQGFRFIKVDTETQQYYQLDSDAVHEKTGHAIRDLIKLNGFKEAKSSRVSPLSSLNTKLSDTVPPAKAVSPDSQQGDYHQKQSSQHDCIVWPQKDCSFDERAALANLAMSIELRQFPETAIPTLFHSTDMEQCSISMFDSGFLPNTDLLVPLNKLDQEESCAFKLHEGTLESALPFSTFSSLGPMATNALNNFEIEFGSTLDTLP
eukprot:Nitzschia sp. Nitz4//scaffold72_size95085//72946//73800//NITZ4_004767-RA/size95085-processed-gene-0.14-mRNA-1//1//CDS//3329557396//7773//frame0